MKTLQEFLAKRLEDPEFRREYEALRPEFEAEKERLRQEIEVERTLAESKAVVVEATA